MFTQNFKSLSAHFVSTNCNDFVYKMINSKTYKLFLSLSVIFQATLALEPTPLPKNVTHQVRGFLDPVSNEFTIADYNDQPMVHSFLEEVDNEFTDKDYNSGSSGSSDEYADFFGENTKEKDDLDDLGPLDPNCPDISRDILLFFDAFNSDVEFKIRIIEAYRRKFQNMKNTRLYVINKNQDHPYEEKIKDPHRQLTWKSIYQDFDSAMNKFRWSIPSVTKLPSINSLAQTAAGIFNVQEGVREDSLKIAVGFFHYWEGDKPEGERYIGSISPEIFEEVFVTLFKDIGVIPHVVLSPFKGMSENGQLDFLESTIQKTTIADNYEKLSSRVEDDENYDIVVIG